MHTFGKFMRNRLPGIGLVSAVALAVAIAATPAAFAQKGKNGKPAESKEFIAAYNAAMAAMNAKDWATELASAQKAAPLAKDPAARTAALQLQLQANANLGKKDDLLAVIETLLAQPAGLPPDQVKAYRGGQIDLYREKGNDAKVYELTTAYIKDYTGTPDMYASQASYAYKQKDFAGAITNINAAIDAAQKAGTKPKESWLALQINSYLGQNDMANYYTSLERAYTEYPKPDYVRGLIERTTKEPKFNRQKNILDVYRALVAAKVELKPIEMADMGEQALTRGNSGESEKAFAAVDKSGWTGVDAAGQAHFKKSYEKAQADAKKDAAGGLAASEKDAAASPKGIVFINVADAYLGAGDNTKAIELFQKGLAKGGLDEGDVAYAKLNLGIAQFRSGQKDQARTTWESIKSDNGAGVLARDWILISKN
jgi:tetratricopeptide (TPR) repeat protein